MRAPRTLLTASLTLLVLVVAYALLDTHGMTANAALAFTLLGGCVLGLILFTIRIGRGGHAHDHDHE